MHRVFLSSTSKDLQAYREAVHKAIDRLGGFHLVKMEDFTPTAKTPRQVCDDEVRTSQLFVGLLGHYYGSCPPKETASFTELEYLAATEADIEPLMFVAPDDLALPVNLREPDESFARQQAFRKKVRGAHVSSEFRTPDELAAKVTAALANWASEKKETRIAGLEGTPSAFQPRDEGTTTPAKPLDPNPYRGLEAFRIEDAERFFGREDLVEKLWQRFLALHGQGHGKEPPTRFLAILGASGSGKSSVAQAGLLAEIQKRPLPGRINPKIAVFTPEARPFESLAMAFAKLVSDDTFPVGKAKEFEKLLREAKDGDGLRYLVDHLPNKQPVILLIDQFEEVFSLCDIKDERFVFIQSLLNAARQPNGPLSVLITLRSDFLGAVNDHSEFSQMIAAQHEVVPVMTEDELHRAIIEPARGAGKELDAATVDLLIEQSAGEQGALPLLEFALKRIWEGLSEGRAEADTLRELGGVGGAVAKEAKALFQDLKAEDQAIAKRAFLTMVRLGEGTRDTRRRALIEEIVAAGEDREDVERVLRIFANPARRLITLAGTEEGKQTVEVSHEALIDQWSDLRGWLDEGRDDERFRRRLNEATQEWQAGRGATWTGVDLGRLRAFARQYRTEMTAPQLTFFKASYRRYQRAIGVRFVALAAVTGLALLAFVQWQLASEQAGRAEEQARLAKNAETQANKQRRLAEEEKVRAEEQTELAKQEAERANIRESLYRAEQARKMIRENYPVTGMQLALAGLPADPNRLDRPWIGEAAGALVEALGVRWELRVFNGHGGYVSAVALSADGTRIVSGSEDSTVRIWDTSSGRELKVLRGHGSTVYTVAFSADGTRIVSGSWDATARLWDASSGKQLQVFDSVPIDAVALSADGARVVSGSRDTKIRIWDASSGEQLLELRGHQGEILAVAISSDGTRIVSASDDNTVRLWDASSGKELQVIKDHRAGAVAFSSEGTHIVSISDDNTIRLLDALSGKLIQTLEGHQDEVMSVALSGDGSRIVSGARDLTIRLWDASSGEQLQILKDHKATVYDVAISADGTRIVSGGRDTTVRLWDASGGDQLNVLQGHTDIVTSVAISGDDTRVVTGSKDNTVRIWDASSGLPLQTLEGHEAEVSSVAISPDGARIISGSWDATVRIWDASSGEELQTLEGHKSRVFAVAFSADGTRIVSGSSDMTIRIWDALSGEQLQILKGHETNVTSVAVSSNGTRIVSGAGGPLRRFRDRTVRVWDASSGAGLEILKGHEAEVNSVAASPDGTRIFSGSKDGTVRIWDALSGEQLQVLRSHEATVTSLSLSSDGTRIGSSSNDTTIRIWDTSNGEEILVIRGHEAAVTSLAFSADGARIVAGSEDKMVRIIWIGRSRQELIEHAYARLPRELTEAERRRFYLLVD